jgi:hypothetical protein
MPGFLMNSIVVGVAVAAALVVGLVLLEGSARPLPERGAPAQALDLVVSRPRSRRRLAVGLAAVAVTVVALAGIVFVGSSDPLRAAGPATGSGPLYLGTVPATHGGLDNVDFAAVSGGEIQMEFSLVNTGAFPLTITGMNEPINGSPMWEMDGYFASGSVVPAGQASDGTTHRFEIQPHVSVPVVAILHLRKCTPSTPAAPAPGQTPSAWAAVAAEAGGFTSFGSLTIVYEMLGLTHTTTLVLPANLVMIDANSVLCPGDGSAPPTNYP